jgi:hypothetical protein
LLFVAAPVAIGAIAACATMLDKRPEPRPKAEVVGDPASCIPISQIRETRIRDDWTIDFISSGNRAWRNALTQRCPGLRSRNAITYETSLTQLCNTDIVYVLETAGGIRRGPACSLGQFVPVRLERR